MLIKTQIKQYVLHSQQPKNVLFNYHSTSSHISISTIERPDQMEKR